MRTSGVAAVFAAAILASGCASSAEDEAAAAERFVNQGWLDAEGDAAAALHAEEFLVVQDGALAAHGPAAEDAVREAAALRPGVRHRFVFRAGDRGERLYRMAFLPEGGRVAGKGFFDALGLRAQLVPGSGVVVGRPGEAPAFGTSAEGRLAIEVRPLDGDETAAVETLDVAVDPDFDGGLLLDPETAARLGLARHEIPGSAEVQTLSRPIDARRALIRVRVPLAEAEGVVEALVERPRAPRR